MASASAGAEVCSNGYEVVHYSGNSDQIIRSDGNSDGDEVLWSDGNGDEVIRSDGNSNSDDVLRSDGNDDEVIRSDGNDNEVLCSGNNGDEIGDKMLVVEDDGKLPVRTKEDEQAAQALVHLASLPIDVFISDFARHEAYKNWRKRSGDENVRAGQAIYTHVFHLLWRRLKSVDAIQNFGAEDRCDERGQGKN